MKCPLCGSENFPGEDNCANCGSDLRDVELTAPKSRIAKKILSEPVTVLELPEPLNVLPDDTVASAVSLMKKEGHGSVLVVDNGNLIGIFSERDLLKRVVAVDLDLDATKMSDVMTRDPEYLDETATIAYALNKMSVAGIRHVPVMSGGKPVGFVSVRKVLNYLAALTLD